MVTSEDIAKRYLQIDDERFFAFSEQDENAIYDRFRFKDENFFGLALAMPATVDLQVRNSIPAVVFFQCDALRAWDIDSYYNLAVVAVSRVTGAVMAGRVRYNEKREFMRKKPVRVKGPRPTGDSLDTMHYGVYPVNLLERTVMPHAGEYLVRALEFDWLSNTVTVKVKGPAPSAADIKPLNLSNAVQFQKKASSPTAPPDGLALNVPDRAAPGVKSIRVSGAGRIALPGSATILREATPEGVRAWVKGALVIAQKDDVPPLQFELILPIFSSKPVQPGDAVDIFFEQDIGSHLEEPKAGTSYRIYWLMDRYISAAMPLEVADR